uniref:ORF2 n=1 Tax=Gorilla anellovirus TaxID=1743411 RepID=A0A0S2GMG5_9VIRU|nr:ORF2 [Gorilla anellovirus]
MYFIYSMSDVWKPSVYGVNGRELQWLNGTLNNHDSFCGCDNPVFHFFCIVTRRGTTLGLNKKALKTIQKCLTTGKETSDGEETGGAASTHTPEDGFDFGDLETLFAKEDDTAEG